jgi:hypothetical protein
MKCQQAVVLIHQGEINKKWQAWSALFMRVFSLPGLPAA